MRGDVVFWSRIELAVYPLTEGKSQTLFVGRSKDCMMKSAQRNPGVSTL